MDCSTSPYRVHHSGWHLVRPCWPPALPVNTRNGTWLVLQGNLLQAAVTRLDGICTAAGGGGGTATEEFLPELPGNKGRPEAATAEHAQQTSPYNKETPLVEEAR